VRYSFHGKMRTTGQTVDGHIDAPSSSEAIDLLADQGIIGVYSVFADPLAPSAPKPAAPTPDMVLQALVDKLTGLVGQVETILSKPVVQYVRQSEGGRGPSRRASLPQRNTNEAQNSALKDIFQNNLELRKSLEKLANLANAVRGHEAQISSTAPPPAAPMRTLQAQSA